MYLYLYLSKSSPSKRFSQGPPCQRPQRKQDLGTCGTPHASALDLRARHALHTQPPPLPHIPSHSRRPPLHRTALTAEYAARLPQVPSSQRRRDTPTSSWGECSLHPYFARIPSHLVTQPTHTRRPALHRTAPTAEYAARLPQVPSSLPRFSAPHKPQDSNFAPRTSHLAPRTSHLKP